MMRRIAVLILLLSAARVGLSVPPLVFELGAMHEYGHRLGEIVTLRWYLRLSSGVRIVEDQLPALGELNESLDLVAIDLRSGERGESVLTASYQLFPTDPYAASIAIPSIPLQVAADGKAETIPLPAQYLALTPYALDDRAGQAEGIRPLHDIARLDLGVYLWPLVTSALLFIALLIAGGWHYLAVTRRPFTAALSALRRLQKRQPQSLPEGLRIFHVALNRAGGSTLLHAKLDDFLRTQPALAGLRLDLDRFFISSRAAFFDPRGLPPDYTVGDLVELCKACCIASEQQRDA